MIAFISSDALAEVEPHDTIVVVADQDDDDSNHKSDAEENVLAPAAHRDLWSIDAAWKKTSVRILSGADHVRLRDGSSVQGTTPGIAEIEITRKNARPVRETLSISAFEFHDANQTIIDPAIDHVSLTQLGPSRDDHDPNAIRVWIGTPKSNATLATPDVTVESLSAAGVRLDAFEHLTITRVSCGGSRPSKFGVLSDEDVCWQSDALRLVTDEVDRLHPLARGRALRAEIGGAVVIRSFGKKQMVRVGGPRANVLGNPGIERLRARVRPWVLRMTPGGVPAVGGSDAAAVATVRADLAVASATWGQCGITLGDTSAIDVRIVDPPPPHLLAIGDVSGLPASGGVLHLLADGKSITVKTGTGYSVQRVAHEVAESFILAGFVPFLSSNARATGAASSSVDVSVRHRDGSLASLDVAKGIPLSTDGTLSVRIGAVELAGGLEHFGDDDSETGTLEERTLIKAWSDDDPTTIDLFIVPFFGGVGRIGESFITGESPSMRNIVLLDRGGVRARRTSLTLAHELGHIFLMMPGHPDDYGEDTPTLLLDSDASDASPFGPKRIPTDECVRALKETGPGSRVPLLTPWPFTPITVR